MKRVKRRFETSDTWGRWTMDNGRSPERTSGRTAPKEHRDVPPRKNIGTYRPERASGPLAGRTPGRTAPKEHRDRWPEGHRDGPETLPEQLSALNSREFFLILAERMPPLPKKHRDVPPRKSIGTVGRNLRPGRSRRVYQYSASRPDRSSRPVRSLRRNSCPAGVPCPLRG